MEVAVHSPDFHFDSTCTTPYVSAPSSPKRFGVDYYHHCTSAPSSPTRAAAIFAQFAAEADRASNPDTYADEFGDGDDDFAFDFSGQMEKGSLPPPLTAADELFEEGKIRPLKPPPRLQNPILDDPTSSKSPKGKGLWSPRRKGGEKLDPFTAAMVEVTRDRGRERLSSSTSRKGSRSLSPLRVQKIPNTTITIADATSSSSSPAAASKSGGGVGSRKWRLRDLLLFRSASEGRVTGDRSKDPLRKFSPQPSSSSLLFSPRRRGEESRGSSFRSTDSGSTRRKAAVSPHEAHYTANRAASEELKKKTPLAYRQGLFGCLRFNPVANSIARGFGGGYSFNRS